MMHRCSSSSSQGNNRMGQCSCGLFHTSQTNSFTMLFSMPPSSSSSSNNHHKCYNNNYNDHHQTDHQIYPFPSSSSSVDCTLSLGTPSTRLSQDDHVRHEPHRSTSSFCWDILQPNKNTTSTPPYSSQTHKQPTRATGTGTNTNTNADSLLARRCANCDTTSTPLWRNGPRGPKSLCNACGIRFKKEERRATAANGNASSSSSSSSSSSTSMEQQQNYYGSTSWGGQKMSYYSQGNHELRFIEESHRDSDSSNSTAIPFLSWRLNVTDRPSLVHDFTR